MTQNRNIKIILCYVTVCISRIRSYISRPKTLGFYITKYINYLCFPSHLQVYVTISPSKKIFSENEISSFL